MWAQSLSRAPDMACSWSSTYRGQRPHHLAVKSRVEAVRRGPWSEASRLQCAGVDVPRLQVHMDTTLHRLGPRGVDLECPNTGQPAGGARPLFRRPRGLGGGSAHGRHVPMPLAQHLLLPSPGP